jgi:hypothetical protein
MSMVEWHQIDTYVEKPVDDVRRFLAEPRNFPLWAAIDEATFRQTGPLEWTGDAPAGPRNVRFSPPNDEGIFDHAFYAPGTEPVMMPMRATAQGTGTLIAFSFHRPAGMGDDMLASSLEWIRLDFLVLKSLLEL